MKNERKPCKSLDIWHSFSHDKLKTCPIMSIWAIRLTSWHTSLQMQRAGNHAKNIGKVSHSIYSVKNSISVFVTIINNRLVSQSNLFYKLEWRKEVFPLVLHHHSQDLEEYKLPKQILQASAVRLHTIL